MKLVLCLALLLQACNGIGISHKPEYRVAIPVVTATPVMIHSPSPNSRTKTQTAKRETRKHKPQKEEPLELEQEIIEIPKPSYNIEDNAFPSPHLFPELPMKSEAYRRILPPELPTVGFSEDTKPPPYVRLAADREAGPMWYYKDESYKTYEVKPKVNDDW